MSDVMQRLETWNAGVSTAQLWAAERKDGGRNLTHSRNRRMQNPRYREAFYRLEEAYLKALGGDGTAHRFLLACLDYDPSALSVLHEAISPSDFPLLFGDTIDRVLLAKYQATPPIWEMFIKTSRVIDFKTVERYKCTRGRGRLPKVEVGESYESDKPGESHYSFKVAKYGGVRDIYWETLVNDDLGAFQDTPGDFAFQAQQTEAYNASQMYVANTTLYAINHTAEDGNTYSNRGTAPLTANNLAAALSTMGEYPGDDPEGMPILNDPIYIVVGTRNMQFRAEQILNSVVVAYTDAVAGEGTNLPTNNLIPTAVRNRMQVIYDPYMRLFDSTNYATSWYLFSDPNDGWAIEYARLMGYETPQLFMRASAQMLAGGGLADPMAGGFDNDAVSYKVRVVNGGSHTNAVGGWRFTYWSDGTG